MHILDQEIKRIISSQKEYRYGHFLDGKELIERMTISLDESSRCLRVNARVDDHGQKHVLSMKITESGEILQYHCGCVYETSQTACRHCLAVLLFLKNLHIESYPYFYEKNKEADKMNHYLLLKQQREKRIMDKKHQDSLDLIDLYKNRLLRESQIPLLSRQYQLKVFVSQKDNHLEISLKISHEKQSFIIKNIGTFLHAIDYHETLRYGKAFEFVHSLDAFDDDSLEILYFVKECYLRNQKENQEHLKTLVIDSDILDHFYDLMNALPSSYADIAFLEKDMLISLELQEKEESYVLDFKDYQNLSTFMMSHHHLYEYNQDTLYRYRLDEEGKCLILVQKLLESQDGLYIQKEGIYEFYRYVLADIIDFISLNTHLFDDYCQENGINLYADMTSDDQICVQLEYLYDDQIRYGFDKTNQQLSSHALIVENYLEPYIEDQDGHVLYLTYDHEWTYTFLREGLPYLSHYCQVYVSDHLKHISQSSKAQIKVGVSLSNHLLDFHIESMNIPENELYDILKAYKKKRKFYKLKSGQLLSLEHESFEELNQLSTILQLDSTQLENNHIQVPSYRLFELENLSHQQTHLSYFKSQELETYIQNFQKPQKFEVPKQYQDILRSYQKEGYRWLRLMESYGFSGILADDMGLGKTLQMIVYFEAMKNQKRPSLVITPASLLLNWQDEIQKFSSHLKVLCVYGSKNQRDELIKDIENVDVVITSYDYMRRDIDDYEMIDFHTVVLDEAQYIKNPKTRNALSVKRLKAKQRFALTGTPIENSLAELWSIFDFLMPHYLHHYAYFLEKYERPIVKDHDEDKQKQLKHMISPFILRRNKKDVLKELPEKIEKTMFISFEPEEEKLYLSSLLQVNKELQKKLNVDKTIGRMDVLAMLTRLRQICQDPRLLYDDISEPSSKLKGCMELIHSLKENHKKVLLFSSFTSVLELVRQECEKEHLSYYQLDGSVSKEKRQQLVKQFQNDDTTVFLISLKAGGSGLNLTSAQAVIHFDPWWNISAQNQATDRAYRIGQKESVQVFSLIMKNSIEEKIQELQKHKKNLADMFVEGNEGVISTMSIDDLMSLLHME